MEEKEVFDEIVTASRDVPRPRNCVPDDYVAYDKSEERVYHLPETWWDLAGDSEFLTSHDRWEVRNMTTECFLYFLPGYMLGVIRLKDIAVGVRWALVVHLSAHRGSELDNEIFQYLTENLTLPQKRAVAHWLQLQLEGDRKRCPESYQRPGHLLFELAFDKWRQHA